MAQCTAKSKRTGKQCRNPAGKHTDKCYKHGDKSLRGAAHPNFKHGRRSKYLDDVPTKLRDAIERAREAENYLTLREELELVDAQIVGALDAMYGGEEWAVHWRAAKRSLKAFLAASRHGDEELARHALYDLREHIEGGAGLETNMLRLQRFIDLRRKLAGTEGRNIERSTKVLTAGELMGISLELQLSTRGLVDKIVERVAEQFALDAADVRKTVNVPFKEWVDRVRERTVPAPSAPGTKALPPAAN